jgi:N-acyl-D-amino-acid deacylase
MSFGPFGLVLAALTLAAGSPDLDLVLRGGRIVDGTGNPAFVGDLGLKDGYVVAAGQLSDRPAARTIDVTGLIVAPGFIDIHNHGDESLLVDGDAPSLIRQGVTSVILGEGGSAAPSRAFPSFRRYFDQLTASGIAVNVGSYVGSSQVWVMSRGERMGPPTHGELEKMRNLVRQAMNDGALGVSSSLTGPPGAWIDTESLVVMCTAAAPLGGIYSTHLRHEGAEVFTAVDEALAIGRRAHVPVDIIHLKISDHTLWGQMPRLIDKIAKARAAGATVTANVYPYHAGQNDLASIVPPWAHEGGAAALVHRLKDPALRARIEGEITRGIRGWYDHYTATGSWQGMMLVQLQNPAYKRWEGKRMDEVIATLGQGRDPFAVFFQLLIDNGGTVPTIFFHHTEEDMRAALVQPFVSIGSDGGSLRAEGPSPLAHPHPRFFGTFPRVLGRYVRDEKVLSLEEAIRKMTSANSSKIGIGDRGTLGPGQRADITVFDPAKIIDTATFENPRQYALGVVHVIVGGQMVLDGGKPTGRRPGRILLGPGTGRLGPSAEHHGGGATPASATETDVQ